MRLLSVSVTARKAGSVVCLLLWISLPFCLHGAETDGALSTSPNGRMRLEYESTEQKTEIWLRQIETGKEFPLLPAGPESVWPAGPIDRQLSIGIWSADSNKLALSLHFVGAKKQELNRVYRYVGEVHFKPMVADLGFQRPVFWETNDILRLIGDKGSSTLELRELLELVDPPKQAK